MDPKDIRDLASLRFAELDNNTQQTIALLTKGYVDDMRNKLKKGQAKLSRAEEELMEGKLKAVLAYVYPIIIKANVADEFSALDYLPFIDPKEGIAFNATIYEQGPEIGSERHCQVSGM